MRREKFLNLRIRERKVLKNLRNKLTRTNLVLVVGSRELLPLPLVTISLKVPSDRLDLEVEKNEKRDKSHDNSTNLNSADPNGPDVDQDGDNQFL